MMGYEVHPAGPGHHSFLPAVKPGQSVVVIHPRHGSTQTVKVHEVLPSGHVTYLDFLPSPKGDGFNRAQIIRRVPREAVTIHLIGVEGEKVVSARPWLFKLDPENKPIKIERSKGHSWHRLSVSPEGSASYSTGYHQDYFEVVSE